MAAENLLAELRRKAAMKDLLETKLGELRDQQRKYEGEVRSLKILLRDEQEDVAKLETGSLANYFFQVIGRLDEKLDKERQEAYAAKVKLDAAERELANIGQDVSEMESRMVEARVAQARYQEELEKKRIALKKAGDSAGEAILELERQLGVLEAQRQEIREAVSAGSSAQGTADQILSELEDADDWNTWDMLGGGGIITHMAKYERLDRAQKLVNLLQSELRRFKTELADVSITADLQVSIEGFLRYADVFFDGLFADWAVGNKITESMNSVYNTRSQISAALEKLRSMESAADQRIRSLRAQLEEFVVNT